MKTGKCPKCDSNEVFRGIGHGPGGCNATEFIRVSHASKAELTHYVCGVCGYNESYVEDGKNLDKIKSKWMRVSHS